MKIECWKPFFKPGDHVKVLGRPGIPDQIATCVKLTRPTPFLGMEEWIVKFDNGEEATVAILEENKV